MVLPELDVKHIQKWCARKEGDSSRLEVQTTNMHVTVVRVTDAAAPGKSVARFRYTMTTGEWTLYWPDNSGKFHRYKRTPGSKLAAGAII